MLKNNSISFLGAVLININIVIGAAFFLGAPDIAQRAGYLAPIAWLTCAALLLPLVFIFSKFARKYPEAGGIYVYSENELGRFWGYLGAWLYFIGTAAGNAMVLRCFAKYLYEIPVITQALQAISFSQLMMELLLVGVFSLLSLRNVQLFERTQIVFSTLKVIPFIVLAIGAVILFSPTQFVQASSFTTESMFNVMSTVLFAYIGIEACSAIIDKINNSARDGFKVILTSFGLIAAIYAIAQLFIIGIQGQSTDNPFLTILPKIIPFTGITTFGNQIVYTAILFSFLGGFYGMFYVNNWNLYAIAQQKSIAGSDLWQKLNSQQAPWASIALQGVLLAIMLIVGNNSSLLIVMGDIGVLLAYGLTAIAFMWSNPSILGFLGITSATIFGGFLLQEIFSMGISATIPFWIIAAAGLIMYRKKSLI